MAAAPRVFVSHASEDKDRFVLAFATRLRVTGIDAWLDNWEMLPGASLIDKLFEEGIKNASAVIVVLSQYSVNKPWVREELNAAAVKRINTGSKLIPVVIDDCEVPEVLKALLWEPIKDMNNYDDSFNRIVAAVFGINDKPPIGSAPGYTQSFTASIGGLTRVDSLVLKVACDYQMEHDEPILQPETVFHNYGAFVVPEGELKDALHVLDQEGLITTTHFIGGGWEPFRITMHGFEEYAKACIEGYDRITRDVIAALVNRKLTTNEAVEAEVKQPGPLVDHILDQLEARGHLKLSKTIGTINHVFNVSPTLKRALQQ